jgi:ABC-type multidrug transport system fused ATPase/permease subunit
VSRLGNDTTLIQTLTTSSMPEIVLSLIKVIGCISLMIVLSPKLAGLTFGVVVFLLLAVIPFGVIIGKVREPRRGGSDKRFY